MTGVSTSIKNMTIDDPGLTQSVISKRLLNPFRLTEAEIKSITDLNTIVRLLEKALAVEKEMDRKLNEREKNIITHLEEQEELLEEALVAVVQKEELRFL